MTRLTRTLTASAALALFAAPVFAAESPSDFVSDISVANHFEIESSKLALEKSQNADVKKFAQQMIDDHTQADKNLTAAAAASNSNVKPVEGLDSKHQKLLDTLQSESGSDFDKDYVADQTKGHKQAVKLLKDYSKNGTDASLKSFAQETLPTVQQHLDHVKQLKSSI